MTPAVSGDREVVSCCAWPGRGRRASRLRRLAGAGAVSAEAGEWGPRGRLSRWSRAGVARTRDGVAFRCGEAVGLAGWAEWAGAGWLWAGVARPWVSLGRGQQPAEQACGHQALRLSPGGGLPPAPQPAGRPAGGPARGPAGAVGSGSVHIGGVASAGSRGVRGSRAVWPAGRPVRPPGRPGYGPPARPPRPPRPAGLPGPWRSGRRSARPTPVPPRLAEAPRRQAGQILVAVSQGDLQRFSLKRRLPGQALVADGCPVRTGPSSPPWPGVP